jgi:hypothetical protein
MPGSVPDSGDDLFLRPNGVRHPDCIAVDRRRRIREEKKLTGKSREACRDVGPIFSFPLQAHLLLYTFYFLARFFQFRKFHPGAHDERILARKWSFLT